jgi:hypothetical protein
MGRYVSKDRVYNDELQDVGDIIFNKTRFSGMEIARTLGINHNTLWSWFFRRGITPEHANNIADILNQWAIELLDASRRLRAVQWQESEDPPVRLASRKRQKATV